MRVSVLGLGNMGAAIARNILKAGHDLTVWNRSEGKAAGLAAEGATVASSPAHAVAGAEVALTMLADDQAIEAVVFGPDGLATAHGPAVHVGLSTISLAMAERLTEAHGDRYVSAPVFGRPSAAAAAKLFVVAAGPAAAIDHAQPILDVIGQRTFRMGEAPRAANLTKLCGNFMIMASLEAMGEALALAEKSGLPKAELFEVLTSTLFGSPIFTNYGPPLLTGAFRPAGLTTVLGLKDMSLVAAAASDARVPMPLLGIVRDHLLQMIAQGGADMDWSAIAKAIDDNAGIQA